MAKTGWTGRFPASDASGQGFREDPTDNDTEMPFIFRMRIEKTRKAGYIIQVKQS